MQVSLNTKVDVTIAQALKLAAKDLDRSQASIVAEALTDWLKKTEKQTKNG